MFNEIEMPVKEFKALALALGYKRRKVRVIAVESVMLYGLNWESGSRNIYHGLDIANGSVITASGLNAPAPWDNKAEGSSVELRDGFALVRTGVFMGKDSIMVVYVHPSNMPKRIA